MNSSKYRRPGETDRGSLNNYYSSGYHRNSITLSKHFSAYSVPNYNCLPAGSAQMANF